MRARRSGESALLLLDAIDVLSRGGVSYAVIGAMAASVHGVVRASMDADDPIAAVLALTDEFGNRVDLLVGLRGLEPAAFERVLEVPFEGERLRIIGREDFIAMKLFAHGPQDIVDAELALTAAGRDLDLPLLKRLASQYGPDTAAALEKALAARR